MVSVVPVPLHRNFKVTTTAHREWSKDNVLLPNVHIKDLEVYQKLMSTSVPEFHFFTKIFEIWLCSLFLSCWQVGKQHWTLYYLGKGIKKQAGHNLKELCFQPLLRKQCWANAAPVLRWHHRREKVLELQGPLDNYIIQARNMDNYIILYNSILSGSLYTDGIWTLGMHFFSKSSNSIISELLLLLFGK